VLLSSSGSERLLHEELHLDRATLVDIAQSFGGRRWGCPGCRSKMSSLMLRGVDVDLCFHCGSLWLDHGELERLSDRRYKSPLRQPSSSTDLPAKATPQASANTVRLDARHPLRRGLSLPTTVVGLLLVQAYRVGAFPNTALVIAAACAVLVAFNMRRSVVDVWPRARRLLRSRSLLPADARDPRAEVLDDERFVVVRPWRLWLTETALVDSCGRTLVQLAIGRRSVVLRQARAQAHQLGALLVLPGEHAAKQAMWWASSRAHVVDVRRQPAPRSERTFIAWHTSTIQWSLRNAVPAQGTERGAHLWALCFYVAGIDGTVAARLHDDNRGHIIAVGADGLVFGCLQRRRLPGLVLLTATRARTAHRLHVRSAAFDVTRAIVDDHGHVHGYLHLNEGTVRLEVKETTHDDAILLQLLLWTAAIEPN
jgi:Zn-finger nucleic acid-binding protein